MLAFIKSNYQIGDTIEVTCSEGVIAGQIEYVNNKYIVLRQSNGKVCGIAASDIRTFTANSPVPMMPCNGKHLPLTQTFAPMQRNVHKHCAMYLAMKQTTFHRPTT